jgi:DNA-binding transcriptional LysR family regulator
MRDRCAQGAIRAQRLDLRMSDTALKYLHAAALHGSMRAAGETLNVAVSSISRQIAQLEAGLGVRLLETGRRTIRLTAAGRIAFDFYQAQLAQRQAFVSRLEDLRNMKAGSVTLAIGDGAPSRCVHRALAAFQARRPTIDLVVLTGTSEEASRWVVEDEADIALGLEGPLDPKLRMRASSPQPLNVFVHRHHALAGRRGITLEELSKHALCLARPGSRLRQLLAPGEMRQQTWLRATITTDCVQTMRDLARLGRAAIILPRSAAQADLDEGTLAALPLLGVDLEPPQLALMTRLGRQLPEASVLLLAALEQELAAWRGTAGPSLAECRRHAETWAAPAAQGR